MATLRNKVKREFKPTWQYAFNLGPTLQHRRHRPELTAEAERVLESLRCHGAAMSSVEAITGNGALLAELQASAVKIEADEATARGKAAKPFLTELLGPRPLFDPASPVGRLALDPQVKGVVDHYLGLRTRVADANYWRTIPRDAPPSASQLWHRDVPDDRHITKVFVYLVDVDSGTGPFWYAMGRPALSHRRLPVEAYRDGLNYRVSDEELNRHLPRETWREFVGPAGTVIFADTVGFHRGGWATTSSRLVAHCLYTSRAATSRRRVRLADGVDPSGLTQDLALAR